MTTKEPDIEQVKAEIFKYIRSGSPLPEKHQDVMEIGITWAFQYLEQNGYKIVRKYDQQ